MNLMTLSALVPKRLAGCHEHMAGLNVDYYLLSYFIRTSFLLSVFLRMIISTV